MPKVYFVGSSYMGCNYVRCLIPQLHGGWNGSYTSLYSKRKSMDVVAEELHDADIVVFHRPDSIAHHKLAIGLQQNGKKIIFENDDTCDLDKSHPFFNIDGFGDERLQKNYKTLVDNFILNCDAVTTTTEFLADEYRKINKDVNVLPNCIDPDDWPEPKHNDGEKVRILLTGSASYTQDFTHISEYLRELDKRDDIQLVLYGLWGKKKRRDNPLVEKTYGKEYDFWDSLPNLEHAEWTEMKDYQESLNNLKIDIMLIPRKENYFNRCKSNVKFLEASMLEISVVAQSFLTKDSPYDNVIDGKNGLLATDLKSWKEQTEKLIADKTLRREMGQNARKYVLENFHIEKHINKWKQLYERITRN